MILLILSFYESSLWCWSLYFSGETESTWNRDAPVCQTCDPSGDVSVMPEVTDENIDVLCHIGLNNMRQCHLTCKNGGKINGKKTAKPKCFCNRRSQDLPGGCFWMQNRQPVDTSSLTCSEPKKPFVPAPGSCEAKDKTCTTLPTSAIKWRFHIFMDFNIIIKTDTLKKPLWGKKKKSPVNWSIFKNNYSQSP